MSDLNKNNDGQDSPEGKVSQIIRCILGILPNYCTTSVACSLKYGIVPITSAGSEGAPLRSFCSDHKSDISVSQMFFTATVKLDQ